MTDIFARTRDAGGDVAERKGATYYGVATGLMRIVEAIVRDQRTILSVSSVIDGRMGVDDVALSLPSIVGRHGIERVLDLDLSPDETEALRRSAGILRETQTKLPL
jgi:L-lactate dehydrogenase